jgi:hypothetical protein
MDLNRRKFFSFLGGAATIPMTQIQALVPEAKAVEIRRDAEYLLVVDPCGPDRAYELEEWLASRGLTNLTVLGTHGQDLKIYRLEK